MTSIPTRVRRLAGIVGLALLLAAPSAHAERRVVVLDFAGSGTDRVQGQIERMVRGDFELVSSRDYRRAARAIDARRMRQSHVAQVARRIEADAVIHGKVIEHDGRRLLKLRIRAGRDGGVVKKYAVALRGTGLSRSVAETLERKLGKVIARVPKTPIVRKQTRTESPRTRSARSERRATRKPRRARTKRVDAVRERERRARAARKAKAERRARANKKRRAAATDKKRRARTDKKRRAAAADKKKRRARADKKKRRARADKKRRAAAAEKKRRARDQRRAERDRKRRAAAERKRRAAAAEKKRRAERERKRRAERKKRKKKKKEKPFKIVEKTDDRGNVIDDEVPDVLRKK